MYGETHESSGALAKSRGTERESSRLYLCNDFSWWPKKSYTTIRVCDSDCWQTTRIIALRCIRVTFQRVAIFYIVCYYQYSNISPPWLSRYVQSESSCWNLSYSSFPLYCYSHVSPTCDEGIFLFVTVNGWLGNFVLVVGQWIKD